MTRRFLAIIPALLLVLIAPVALAGPGPLQLLTPTAGAFVTDTHINFTWTEVPDTVYQFSLRSTDGEQRLKYVVSSVCASSECTFSFDPDVELWSWRENQVYKWRVTALSEGGLKVAQSAKWKFTTDLLPDILLVAPADRYVSNDGFVEFQWDGGSQVKEYRIEFTTPTGEKTTSTWLPHASYCALVTCPFVYDFADLGWPDGKYKWRVVARRDDVSTKVKSGKRVFFLDME